MPDFLRKKQKSADFLLKLIQSGKFTAFLCSNVLLISKLYGRYDDLFPEESSKTKPPPDKRKEIKAWAQERNFMHA